jgi:hypothetical protein
MTRHCLLARQLKRALGVASAGDLQTLFGRLEALAAPDDGATRSALHGLRELIDQFDESYSLYDRELKLSSRSLTISSHELLEANAHIRAKVVAQQRVLGPLQDAFKHLAMRVGLPGLADDEPGLDALLTRLGGLIQAHDLAQRQLRASEASFRARGELSLGLVPGAGRRAALRRHLGARR